MMIIKIVGFKVGQDRSMCYYKLILDEPLDDFDTMKLGRKMKQALEKSDFVSVRK